MKDYDPWNARGKSTCITIEGYFYQLYDTGWARMGHAEPGYRIWKSHDFNPQPLFGTDTHGMVEIYDQVTLGKRLTPWVMA